MRDGYKLLGTTLKRRGVLVALEGVQKRWGVCVVDRWMRRRSKAVRTARK